MGPLLLALFAEGAASSLPRLVEDPGGWYEGEALAYVAEVPARSGALESLIDRLSEEGFTGVVLAPVMHRTPGDPGGLLDHEVLDPRLGTMADLDRWISLAHRAGLSVFLDFPAATVSTDHPWFKAFSAGDRLARDHFTEQPERDGLAWLNLMDRPTRARVLRAAKVWLGRGVDGLRILDAASLVPGDLEKSAAFVKEVTQCAEEVGAIVIADVGASLAETAPFARSAALVSERERSRAIHRAQETQRADPVISVVEAIAQRAQGGRGLVAMEEPSAAKDGPLARQALLLLSGVVILADQVAGGDRSVEDALFWRRNSSALRVGRRLSLPAKGGPAIAAFSSHDGRERAVVALSFAQAPSRAELDLRGLLGLGVSFTAFQGGAELATKSGDRVVVDLPGGSTRAFRALDARPGLTVRFSGALVAGDRPSAIDQGLIFEPRRGFGFSSDVGARLQCPEASRGKVPRCTVRLGASRPGGEVARWMAQVEPGPYHVEVRLADAPKNGAAPKLLAEGRPLENKRGTFSSQVFVRDGKLAIELILDDRGDQLAELEEISVAPAAFKVISPKVEVRPDRLLIRADGPGQVEWRMNTSTAEPAELTPLAKSQGRWLATLGPWPKGTVTRVGWVIHAADGRFLTSARGQEVITQVD